MLINDLPWGTGICIINARRTRKEHALAISVSFSPLSGIVITVKSLNSTLYHSALAYSGVVIDFLVAYRCRFNLLVTTIMNAYIVEIKSPLVLSEMLNSDTRKEQTYAIDVSTINREQFKNPSFSRTRRAKLK